MFVTSVQVKQGKKYFELKMSTVERQKGPGRSEHRALLE